MTGPKDRISSDEYDVWCESCSQAPNLDNPRRNAHFRAWAVNHVREHPKHTVKIQHIQIREYNKRNIAHLNGHEG